MNLEQEIQQDSFKNLYVRGMLNIIYTSNWIMSRINHTLKPHDISPQQYNVLRILRGKFPDTSSLSDIQQRMMDKMSNSTRLVEKLQLKAFVTRKACPNNRRKVDIRITQLGLDLLNHIDDEFVVEQLLKNRLDEQQISELNKLCDRIRD